MGKTIMDIRFSLLAALLLCCTWPVYAQAATSPAAIVIVASGSVQALGEEGFRPLKRRSEVFVGESVLTGPDARTQLRFSDGAIVSLDNDSELLIEAYQRNEEEPEKSKALLRMVTGGLRSITGAIADDYPEGYQVETPLASIGVRGTDFQLRLSAEKLVVAVWDGAVNVANRAGSADIGPTLPFRFAVVTDISVAPQTVLSVPTEFGGIGPEGDSGRDEDSSAEERENSSPASESEASSMSGTTTLTDTLVSDSLPTQQGVNVSEPSAPDPVPTPDPGPTIDPDMPDWFTTKPERTNVTIFAQVRPQVDGPPNYSVFPHLSDAPSDGNGLIIDISNIRNSVDRLADNGYIFQDFPAASAPRVSNFPIYWGGWNGTSEVLFFSSPGPDSSGNYDLTSYDVNPSSSTTLEGTTWAYSTAAALTLGDINQIIPGPTTLTFDSGLGFSSGAVLNSEFSDGVLDVSRSSMSFDLDLNSGAAVENSGAFQFTVIGNGFEQVWESTQGVFITTASITDADQQIDFAYSTEVSNSDGSISAITTGGVIKGFVIPSDTDPGLMGFLGGISLTAGDADSNLSSGYVTVLLESQ